MFNDLLAISFTFVNYLAYIYTDLTITIKPLRGKVNNIDYCMIMAPVKGLIY